MQGWAADTASVDVGDVAIAWHHFGFQLEISNGWGNVIDALQEGRCVMLPGRSQKLEGLCSQSQATPHSVLLHPRGAGAAVKDSIYTMDPWCTTAHFQYVDRDVLYRYWKSLGWSFGMTRGRKP